MSVGVGSPAQRVFIWEMGWRPVSGATRGSLELTTEEDS